MKCDQLMSPYVEDDTTEERDLDTKPKADTTQTTSVWDLQPVSEVIGNALDLSHGILSLYSLPDYYEGNERRLRTFSAERWEFGWVRDSANFKKLSRAGSSRQ